MQVAMIAAGFTANKADQPRRAAAGRDQVWPKNEPTQSGGVSSQFLEDA
jgi:hypothetical protein